MNTRREVLLVAAGGTIGAPLRVAIARIAPDPPGQFPWTTLAINLAGALALGFLAGRWYAHHGDAPWIRPFIGIGLIGSFTTFSTFSVETVDLLRTHHEIAALGYVAISVAAGLAAAMIGLLIGESGRGSHREATRT